MRDIFSEGLLYLDLLELYGSSYAVAELCGVAQSNVFRGASACSKLLNLGLTKDRSAGVYRIERNQDVQRDLRRLNQRLRARENGQLRTVGPDVVFPAAMPMSQASLLRRLPSRWDDPLMSLDFLERGLLDLVVVHSAAVAAQLQWRGGARRSDLYVPVAPFMVSELAACNVLVSGSRHHPFFQKPVSPSELPTQSIFCSDLLAMEPRQSRLPPCCPAVCPGEGVISDRFQQLLQSSPDALLLLSDLELKLLRPCLDDGAVMVQPLEPSPPHQLLLVTLPALVTEPLHQQLTQLLRGTIKDAAYAAQNLLESFSAHRYDRLAQG